jgi:hypothetical protein
MMGGSIEETKVYNALARRQDMKEDLLRDLKRKGYESFFQEIAYADLLVDADYRSAPIDDMLEAKARKILAYEDELDIDKLTAWAEAQGHGLFAQIKRQIGSMGSLKQAFRAIAMAFHPDRAVAQGQHKGSEMYALYERIFKEANDARDNSSSLGDFVSRLGGKDLAPDWQMWYDYLVRKCERGRVHEAITQADRLLESA